MGIELPGRDTSSGDVSPRGGWNMPDFVTPAIDMHAHPPLDRTRTEPMLAAARESGIRRIILSSLGQTDMPPFPSPAEVDEDNREVIALVDLNPGYVYGLAYANPNHEDAPARLRKALEHPGIVGGKLWISCRDGDGRLDPVLRLLETIVDLRVPVLIHSFFRCGGNLPGELSPGDVAYLAECFPQARLVMAHLGGQWLRGVRAVRRCPNVWVDVSGSRAYMGSVEYAVRELGVHRVLFGSDGFFRNFAAVLAKVASADLTVDQKRCILWDNSAALFFGEGTAR